MANSYAVNKNKKKKAPRVLGETAGLRDHSVASLRYVILTGQKVKKKRREYTTDRSFRIAAGIKIDPCPLNEYVTWFSWQLAVCPRRRGKSRYEWHHRTTGPGYYRYQLFKAFRRQRAIYEVGVKVPGKSRIYSVYYRGCYCGMSTSIYKYMLSEESILNEINDIILRRGKIFIRRGVLNDMNTCRYKLCTGYIKTFFSYAWNTRNPQTGQHRMASRRGFQLSGARIREKPSFQEKNSSENSNVPFDENSDTEQHREIKLISVNDRIANSNVMKKSRRKGKRGVKSSPKNADNKEPSSETDDIENDYSDSDSQTYDNENEHLDESDSDSADSQNWPRSNMQKSISDLKMVIDQTHRIQQDEGNYIDVIKSEIVESPESPESSETEEQIEQAVYESHRLADPDTGTPGAPVRLVQSNRERGNSFLKDKESISTV